MGPQVSDSRDWTLSVNMVSNETSEYYASLHIQSALILPQIQGWKCGDSIGNLYLPASGSGRTNAFNWTSFLGNVIWTLFPADTTSSFTTGKEVNTHEIRY